MSDENPASESSKKSKLIQSVSPQSAMDAYFEDMFAASAEDPLKRLSEEQAGVVPQSSELDPEHGTRKISLPLNQVKQALTSVNERALIPKPKLKPKKQAHEDVLARFAEPASHLGEISPLIIPAAFPKLAPVSVQATPKEDTQSVQQVVAEEKLTVKKASQKVAAAPKTASSLDAATALALLEKKKSKLTQARRLKLESKLAQLEKTKQVQRETTALDVSPTVKTAQQPKPIAKTKELVQQDLAPAPSVVSDMQPQRIKKDSLPDWANRRFECLLFSVAGLKLAVPLISLGAIYKIEKEFIPLVGRADWFIGLYHHLERNVRVIDTAKCVMPERCSGDVRSGYKFVIRLGGNDWGIACDAVHESIQLNPDQVKWRTERTKRAWLFGTVIEHMCALIDADSLSMMLEQQASHNPSIFS